MNAFLRGVYSVIPAARLLLVSSRDVAVMLSGKPAIDVKEWAAHTRVQGQQGGGCRFFCLLICA